MRIALRILGLGLLLLIGTAANVLLRPVLNKETERTTPSARRHPRMPDIEIGQAVCGLPFALKSAHTVLLFVSAGCGTCVNNEELFSEFAKSCEREGIDVAWILPPNLQEDWTRRLADAKQRVYQMHPTSVGVSRFPTILTVDRQGQVLAKWTGSLPIQRQAEILASLRSGMMDPPYRPVSMAQALELAPKMEGPQLLVFPDRPSQINPYKWAVREVPVDELPGRVLMELDPQRPVLVDCSTALDGGTCQEALLILAGSGFKQVYHVNMGQRPACR